MTLMEVDDRGEEGDRKARTAVERCVGNSTYGRIDATYLKK